MTEPVKFSLRNRWSGEVIFECELPPDVAAGDETQKLRYAVQKREESRADLSGANLSGADLSGAELGGTNLLDANLRGANLSSANLSGAHLNGAHLSGANLSEVNLVGADLIGADLSDVNLTDARWGSIMINRAPLQLYGLEYPVFVLDKHMQIGCEFHSFADWAAFDDRQITKMGGAQALRFWRQYKNVLLFLAKSDGRGVTEEKDVVA